MKVGFCNLGCKVNTYESEYMMNELKKNGFEISDFNSLCDIYVINTCSVTNNSDAKSRKMIRHARKLNPSAIVVACGCFIEANKKEDLSDLDIDITIGNKDKSKIVELINKYIEDKCKILDVYESLDSTFENMFIDSYNTRTRAFVKIQDGCENFCSYCIIPRVRGVCRSKKLEVCLEEINSLVNNGYKEIVLTGIHTGNYGVDLGINFATLLRELVKIKNLERIRISSIEITELTDEVLEIIRDNDVIVNHFHVPVQSCSNKVLKLMNRKYDIEYFMNKVEELRKIKKDVSITTDIITGHPGEDEEEFNTIIENIKKIKFSKLHVFPYSIRKDTPSSKLKQVPDSVKKDHTDRLLKLSKELEIDFMKKFINKDLDILIENYKDGYSYGHSTNYLDVKIKGELNSSEIYSVKLLEIDYPYIIGKLN